MVPDNPVPFRIIIPQRAIMTIKGITRLNNRPTMCNVLPSFIFGSSILCTTGWTANLIAIIPPIHTTAERMCKKIMIVLYSSNQVCICSPYHIIAVDYTQPPIFEHWHFTCKYFALVFLFFWRVFFLRNTICKLVWWNKNLQRRRYNGWT